jgi:hypothetical protein
MKEVQSMLLMMLSGLTEALTQDRQELLQGPEGFLIQQQSRRQQSATYNNVRNNKGQKRQFRERRD